MALSAERATEQIGTFGDAQGLQREVEGASSETCVERPHHIGAEHAGTKSRKTSTRETTQEVRASLVTMKTLVSAIAGEKIAALQYVGQETKTLSRQEHMKNGHLEDDIFSVWVLGFGSRLCERCRKYHRRVPAREARKKQRWHTRIFL